MLATGSSPPRTPSTTPTSPPVPPRSPPDASPPFGLARTHATRLTLLLTATTTPACGGLLGESAEQDPRPRRPSPAEVGGRLPYAGRWPAGIPLGEGGAWAPAEPCGDPRFVQIRADGAGGWELVTGGADDLRVLPVHTAARTEAGATFDVDPDPTVTLTWVVPDRIAQFSLVPEAAFAAPGVQDLAAPECPE
ncbi:MAG: hypothetical protein R3F59_08750 [Myxococcota bacterium]